MIFLSEIGMQFLKSLASEVYLLFIHSAGKEAFNKRFVCLIHAILQ